MGKHVKLIKTLAWLSVITFVLMPLFRITFYHSMFIAPDEPYGLSDIIEFFLGTLFLFVVGFSSITAIVLIIKNRGRVRTASGYLLALSLALFFLFSPAHELASRFAS